jgi:hypothetical protein
VVQPIPEDTSHILSVRKTELGEIGEVLGGSETNNGTRHAALTLCGSDDHLVGAVARNWDASVEPCGVEAGGATYEEETAEKVDASRLGVGQAAWDDVRRRRKGVENRLLHSRPSVGSAFCTRRSCCKRSCTRGNGG